MENWPKTIDEAGKLLRAGSLTAEALTRHFLRGIDALQPQLNAFITVTGDRAVATAIERDAELRSGIDRGPLHGIPIVYKDNFDTAGVRTTVGSEIFRERVPAQNAAAVERLEQAGTIMLGKANMNEFAAGPSGTNKAYGDTHNPWDLGRSAGGTSSGSGAAVAAGLCLAATGTDTGGSVRIPASWCGVAGLRPTFGLLDVAGIFPRAHSLDCAGPLARSVSDVSLMFAAMLGPDAAGLPGPEFDAEASLAGTRLAVVDDFTFAGVDDDVAAAVENAVETLAAIGATIKRVKIPLLSHALDYRFVFDVLIYEFQEIIGETFRRTENREEVFGPIVQSDLRRAADISAARYRKATETREAQAREMRAVFSDVDAILTPTMPMVAPPLTLPLLEFDRGRQFTLPFGFLGLPALSVPCGFSADRLPIGLQIVGDRLSDRNLLRIGHAYQVAAADRGPPPPCYWNG